VSKKSSSSASSKLAQHVALLQPEEIVRENLSTLYEDMKRNETSSDIVAPQTGVVVLLGHFDHGKVRVVCLLLPLRN
jgi:hypothetical protein